jgi:hypothetical protein
MNSQIKDPYLNYTDKVLFALEVALDRKEMDEATVTSLLIEFGNYPNLTDLQERVESLIATYPALKEVLFKEKEEKSENFDDIVQKYITYLIQNGRASEVPVVYSTAKTLGRSIDAFKKQFPDINNVLID